MSTPDINWFVRARYGLFIHYGLYSLLGRGEWVMNREGIPRDEYRKLADRFTAEKFDADAICELAVQAGMKYVNLTTMHHDGFRLYDSSLSDFTSAKTAARRDLVAEMVTAARKRGLRIALYHSLNNWMDLPDSTDALEDPARYATFIKNTFDRIEELVTKFNPIDVLWYDGWWPFNAEGWRAKEMNSMVRRIQPHILFNGRNGLPGDFGTPEGHLSAPKPWRPWEGCLSVNDSWGYHAGDANFKTPGQIVDLLAMCAQSRGNLLLNIGPRGDGSIPEEAKSPLLQVGRWLKRHHDCVFDTDMFTYDLREKGEHRGDWNFSGPYTAKQNNLYLLARRWPGSAFAIDGVEATVIDATLWMDGKPAPITFQQTGRLVKLTELPTEATDPVCPVIQLICDRPPALYLSGGTRTPTVSHPRYDPCPSDIAH